jgi:hypothetical protein
MNYLQLVQESITRSGMRTALPSTLAGATDSVVDWKAWVQDSWRELQEESTNWWFRQNLDQTLAISASTDEYSMPANLETLNYRTLTIYTTAKTDESPIKHIPYEDWRTVKDTVDSGEGRPIYITERPDGVLQVWPVPAQAYTLRYDGVWDVDTMSLDADTPGSTITSGTQLLPDRYHWVIVWDAIRRYAEHHQEPEVLARAQAKFLAQHARLAERSRPPVYVKAGVLTGSRTRYLRY